MTTEFSRVPLHCKLRVLSGVSVDTWVIIGKLGVGKDTVEKQLLKENDSSTIIGVGKYSLFYLRVYLVFIFPFPFFSFSSFQSVLVCSHLIKIFPLFISVSFTCRSAVSPGSKSSKHKSLSVGLLLFSRACVLPFFFPTFMFCLVFLGSQLYFHSYFLGSLQGLFFIQWSSCCFSFCYDLVSVLFFFLSLSLINMCFTFALFISVPRFLQQLLAHPVKTHGGQRNGKERTAAVVTDGTVLLVQIYLEKGLTERGNLPNMLLLLRSSLA